MIPLIVAHQALLSMGFSRQEYWSGLSCPPPGDLPRPGRSGRNLGLLHCWRILSHQRSPLNTEPKSKREGRRFGALFSVSPSGPWCPWALAVAGPPMQPEKCSPFCRWQTRGPQPAGGSSSFIIMVYWSPDTSGPLAAPLHDAPWNTESGPPLQGQGEGGELLCQRVFLIQDM